MKHYQSDPAALQKIRRHGAVMGISGCILGLGLVSGSAATFVAGFEIAEGYSTAPNAFTGTATNNATRSIPFSGPLGWTGSSSSAGGALVATTSSGSYVGGQALTSALGSPGGTSTYIGARNLGLGGITSLEFDAMAPVLASAQSTFGGWYDANLDGAFNQTPETGVVGGILGSGFFGVRASNYGTSYSSSVAPEASKWYHVTLSYNFAGNSATLSVFNLTDNVAVNLGGTGGNYTATAANLFGATPVNPATYQGVVTRVTAQGFIDNLALTPVPEPGTASMMLLGGFGMWSLLRRRSA
jgi:hypothetical protein